MAGEQQPAACTARHGARVPRGLDAPGGAGPGGGRFGRMFGFLPVHDPGEAIDALVRLLEARGPTGDNRAIQAGYTYLGQFIDHDITFDPTSQLEKVNDPFALENFRTPRLDLDSVYDSGPADQPFLYEWRNIRDRGVKLLVGSSGVGADAVDDLPRNPQGRALLGDSRNDENLIVAQLHLLFIQFHNRVVDHVRKRGLEGAELLRESQRIVRWHYQWIVVHDFLQRIVGEIMALSVLRPRGTWPTVERRFYRWKHEPFIPVEFSGAAYRFGHSMVRITYALNEKRPRIPIFAAEDDPQDLDHLGGFRPLPPKLKIDWSFFFKLPGHPVSNNRPQPSRRIDTNIADRLFKLPRDVNANREALPRLNLRRARALELPSGRDVARAMGVPELTDEELVAPNIDPAIASPTARRALLRATPLWYYVLCEAETDRFGDGGKHLGPVGGRIVAEVLVGLLEGDPHSYLSQWPTWTPELPGADEDDFTMADLIRFTHEGESLGDPPA